MFNRFGRSRRKRSNPFVGILFGIGLFFGSFVMLYMNEGRVDLSKVADDAIPVQAETASAENSGELVAISGLLRSNAPVTDEVLLTGGSFLQLDRSVEMYAWDESRETEEDTDVTRYTYDKEWTSSPQNSEEFNNPTGHFNPPMRYQDEAFTAVSATIGPFETFPDQLFFMQKERLALDGGLLKEGRVDGDYLFIGEGSVGQPQIGDLRIWYDVFPNGQQVTLFAEQEGNQLRPYVARNDAILYRAYPSDRETAIASMRSEYLTLLWGLRVGGLMMMWIGMMVFVSPLTQLLGRVPILGDAGQAVIAVVAFVIAFSLSLITIIISAILHSPIALIILLLLIVGAGIFAWQRRQGVAKTAV